MRKITFIFICSIILLNLFIITPSIFAQDNYYEFIDQLEGKEIVEINKEGLSEENQLRLTDYFNMISTGEPFIYSKITLLFEQLWATGLFSNIVIDAKLNEDDKVILTFIFTELPKVSKISLEGTALIPSYQVERSIEYVSVGKALKDSDIEKDIKNIIDRYKSDGIINTTVSYRKELREDGSYEVVFVIDEGQKVYVENITINGNEDISDSKILKTMETKQSTFYNIEKAFDKDALERDKFNIVELYKSYGYLDIKIQDTRYEIRVVNEKENILGYFIEIDLTEGEQYILTELEFEGNSVFTDEKLREFIEVKIGKPVNEKSLDQSKEKIRLEYYEKGYLYSNIAPNIKKNSDDYTAKVIMSVFEDERVHIESIEIIGSNSETYIIDRLFDLREGEIFNLTKLINTRQNLLNTGYFKAEGTIWQLSQGSEKGLIKLIWLVEEERLRSIFFNAQFGLDGTIGVMADLQLVNFVGNGWDLSFKLELTGFDQFTASANIGTKWLLKYTPISFNASIAYSIQKEVMNPLLLGLVSTPEGYIGISNGYGTNSDGIDLDGDGVVDYYDNTLVDLNNDGVIDENDAIVPTDFDGDGIYESTELLQSGLSYTDQNLNISLTMGYEFFRGFELYSSVHTIFSIAMNPRLGDTSVIDFTGNTLDVIALSDEQIDLLFGKDSLLSRELKEGWITTLGITIGTSFNFTKVGGLSSSGPLASGGWKAVLSVTPFFFGKQFIKARADFSFYHTILPWGKFDNPNLIFGARAAIEMMGPLGESILSYTNYSPGDQVKFDGYTELRGFSGYDRDLYGFGKWIIQLELRGPVPGLEQFLWWVPLFIDYGNIGYNPQGYFYALSFNPMRTTVYDPISGDPEVELDRYTSGHKFSVGFGVKIINIIPLQFYFAWPFEITTNGLQRVVEKRGGSINEQPWWPEFVITGYIYF